MNTHLARLWAAAQEPERLMIGLMSGTSLDGLDIALCRIDSQGVELLHFLTTPYSEAQRERIQRIFAKKMVSLEELTLLNAWIGRLHGEMVNDALRKWEVKATTIDCIASHGQTIYHAPKHKHQRNDYPHHATLQIGDGDHVAVTTGITTLSDFRQRHTAHGGEGAPLAIYGDYWLFKSDTENRILLNMGGIANFTWLPANASSDEVFATDTGTGNTLLDMVTRQYFPHLAFDANAQIAQQGKLNEGLLLALLQHSFFELPLPKTTGQELFNAEYLKKAQQFSETSTVSPADLLHTLTHFSAQSIAKAILSVTKKEEKYKIYASGGGVHNPLLLQLLKEKLPDFSFGLIDELGINADAKEAVLFAVLANQCLVGEATRVGKNSPTLTMGKISFPL